jgi:hypothetical protein
MLLEVGNWCISTVDRVRFCFSNPHQIEHIAAEHGGFFIDMDIKTKQATFVAYVEDGGQTT